MIFLSCAAICSFEAFLFGRVDYLWKPFGHLVLEFRVGVKCPWVQHLFDAAIDFCDVSEIRFCLAWDQRPSRVQLFE
jgi:hypothetical protein